MFLFHLKSSSLFWDIDALVFYDLKFHDVGIKTYILFTCEVCNITKGHKKIIKKCDQVVLFLKNPL